MPRGCFIASVTACLVMALNTTRSMACDVSAFFCLRTSRTCQEMASPSRSGSVARMSLSAFLRARAISLMRLGVDLPEHAEVVVGVDGTVLRRQIAYMAETGEDLVPGAEIFVDRLRLGRGFDYDDVHENPKGCPPRPRRGSAESAAEAGRNMGKAASPVKSRRQAPAAKQPNAARSRLRSIPRGARPKIVLSSRTI